jgi:branched-chain amino acid transport system substrate-binding protein
MSAFKHGMLVATLLGALGAAAAQAQPAALRIGMEEDLSTSMSSVYGRGAVVAAQMAVADFGPEVIGRKIELVTGDGQSKPDIASALVREWFDTRDVQMVTGLSNSAIGLAVQAMARDKNRISIITGSGAPEITGAQCSPNGLHWVIDTYAIDHAVPAPLLEAGDKTWFLLWADITLGKALVRDILPVLKAGGGTVVGQASHPLFTTDMSSPILSAQASKAQVVALMDVGGDLVNAAKQASEFGLIASGQKLAGFWMTVTDVKAIGLDTAGGIYFAEAFYWDQDDAARAWSKRFYDQVGAEPNSYQAGIYGAIMHYLKAVKAAGTADTQAVMAKMRELPVQDFMTPGGGTVRIDGRVIRPIQVLQVKAPQDSHGPWDVARIVATIPGDQAFRPLSESDCPLLTH